MSRFGLKSAIDQYGGGLVFQSAGFSLQKLWFLDNVALQTGYKLCMHMQKQEVGPTFVAVKLILSRGN